MSRSANTTKRHAKIAAGFQTKVAKAKEKRITYYEDRITPKVDTNCYGYEIEEVKGTKGYSTKGKTHWKVRGKQKIYRTSTAPKGY